MTESIGWENQKMSLHQRNNEILEWLYKNEMSKRKKEKPTPDETVKEISLEQDL